MKEVEAGKLKDVTVRAWRVLLARYSKTTVNVKVTAVFRIEYEYRGKSETLIVPVGTDLSLFCNVSGQYARPMTKGKKKPILETVGTFFLRDRVVSMMSNNTVTIQKTATPTSRTLNTRSGTQLPGFR